jgi:hypothetical protein
VTVTNGYATLAQVRAELGGTYAVSDTSDDTLIELSIEAASRQIDGHCGRRFFQDGTVASRTYVAEDTRCLEVDDISTTTGLVVKIDETGTGTYGTTLTINTDFLLLPLNAALEVPVEPYTEIHLTDSYAFPRYSSGRPGVQVTAKFGWPAVPDNIEKACIIQAIQLFKAKDAAFGIATLGDMGGGIRVQAGLNPIARALVAKFAHPAVG